MYKEKRNKILTILLFVQIGLVYFFSKFPDFIEHNYTNGIYIYISIFFRTIFGWIPFSIGDIVYFTLISIFFFFFYFFWGLNYSRKPISEYLEIKKEKTELNSGKYDIDKLKVISDKLILSIIDIQSQLTENDTLPVIVPYTKNEILHLTKNGYQKLSEKFDQFDYKPSSIKKSLFSLPLTYMGFSGYLNPLTGEAQVDYLIPKVNLPMTCSHEVAHQLGMASESEANFIGFLAASFNDDLYFQYSAYMMAIRYTLFDIYRSDPDLYQEYLEKLPKGVLKNIKESDEFWRKYQNPMEPLFKYFYDNYLKYNQQKDGLESYNRMVDLLISYDDKYVLK